MNRYQLRLGNTVYYNEGYAVVDRICGYFIGISYKEDDFISSVPCGWKDDMVHPVLLTEEILSRFEFDKKESWTVLLEREKSLHLWREGDLFSVYTGAGMYKIKLAEIEYLHELENIYFLLSGNELPKVLFNESVNQK